MSPTQQTQNLSAPSHLFLVSQIARLLESACRASARAVNAVLTATYWEISRGFLRQNLQQMREFYLTYPPGWIRQTLSGKSESETNGTAWIWYFSIATRGAWL